MIRDLTEDERAFIHNIACRLTPEDQERLLTDLRNARAEPTLEDGSLIAFHIDGYERPHHIGQHTFPFEGEMRDTDGTPVCVLLFADPSNRLLELEFLRWGDGPLQGPDWTSTEIIPTSLAIKKC